MTGLCRKEGTLSIYASLIIESINLSIDGLLHRYGFSQKATLSYNFDYQNKRPDLFHDTCNVKTLRKKELNHDITSVLKMMKSHYLYKPSIRSSVLG